MFTRKFAGRLRVGYWGALNDVLRIVKQCKEDRSGATAIMIALAMTMLIGMAGLGTEAAGWYVKKRSMQGAADAAAASMAAALSTGASQSTAQNEAYSVAAQNGFTNGVGNTTVTPVVTSFSGGSAARVTINQTEPLLLSALFMSTQPTLAAASVAGANTITFPSGSFPGGVVPGDAVADVTTPSAIPSGTTVTAVSTSGGTTTVTLSNPVTGVQGTGSGGTGDTIEFTVTSSGGSGSGSGGDCLLVLSPNATNALLLNGNVSANLSCGVQVDSSSTQAMLMNGSNTVTASGINVVGNVLKNPTANNHTTPTPTTNAVSVSDPYGVGAPHEVDPPSFSGCDYPTGKTVNGQSATLSPGVYCGNITINGSGITVTFSPGTYILDRHSLVINGSPTVTGNGVVFVFTTSTGSSVGNLTDNGTPVLQLTAPSSGSLAGFVFYQDRRAASGGSNTFNGAGASSVAGAMYFPSQSLTFNGNPSNSSCTQVISKTMTLNGTPGLAVTGCSALGLAAIGAGPTTSTVTANASSVPVRFFQ